MLIPPTKIQAELKKSKRDFQSALRLQSSHLVIDQVVATSAFGADENVFVVYYPERRALMIAPISDQLFKQLHKAHQQMLKSISQDGSKSIALHEILIDHQINDVDRDLEYEFQEALGIINVKL